LYFYLFFHTRPGALLQKKTVHEYLVAILQMTSTFTTNAGTFARVTIPSINLTGIDEGPFDLDSYLLLMLFVIDF
jgi:hypothetical protein